MNMMLFMYVGTMKWNIKKYWDTSHNIAHELRIISILYCSSKPILEKKIKNTI